MLYALAHPASLGVLVLSFVVGLTLHGWVQAVVAVRMGDRRPRQEGRLKPEPQAHLDPFGVVSALISGLGWVKPVESQASSWVSAGGSRRSARGRLLAVSLSGPAVNLVLGVALLLAVRFSYGSDALGSVTGGAAYVLQHGVEWPGLAGALVLAGASQLYLGALSLVPLPPLDGGRLLFGLAPRTLAWQKAEHQLVERNIGVAVLLAVLLVPLGGPLPLLPQLLDTILWPIVRLLGGG